MPNRMAIAKNKKAHERDLMQRGPKYTLRTETKKFLMDGRPFHYTPLSVKYDLKCKLRKYFPNQAANVVS
jgi:hypothetical protein